jgi:hypothetical protein
MHSKMATGSTITMSPVGDDTVIQVDPNNGDGQHFTITLTPKQLATLLNKHVVTSTVTYSTDTWI